MCPPKVDISPTRVTGATLNPTTLFVRAAQTPVPHTAVHAGHLLKATIASVISVGPALVFCG